MRKLTFKEFGKASVPANEEKEVSAEFPVLPQLRGFRVTLIVPSCWACKTFRSQPSLLVTQGRASMQFPKNDLFRQLDNSTVGTFSEGISTVSLLFASPLCQVPHLHQVGSHSVGIRLAWRTSALQWQLYTTHGSNFPGNRVKSKV